ANRIGDAGLDALQQIVFADGAVDAVFAEGEGNDVQLAIAMTGQGADRAILIARDQDRIGARRHRALNEAMRAHPDVDRAHIGLIGLRVRIAALHIPRGLVDDEILLALRRRERNTATADARIIALLQSAIFGRGFGIVIDRTRVIGDQDLRPIALDIMRLTDNADITDRAAIGDAF